MYSFKSDLAMLCLMATCCMAYATSTQPVDDLENEFECPEHWGFYEDPENCMKYYNCENGVAHNINCRTGEIEFEVKMLIQDNKAIKFIDVKLKFFLISRTRNTITL